jgi:hypothetical protein
LVLAALLGYAIVFNTLGFCVSSFLFILFLLKIISDKKWLWIIAVSLLIVVCEYLMFVVWLGCLFPTGPFGV